jgi:Putative transposase
MSFGSYAANFHPHVHALVTDGLLAEGGRFFPLPDLDPKVLSEAFRRLVLDRLHEAGRLSDRFKESLLSWVHSGFSVHAGPPIPAADGLHLERMARYLTRAPIAVGNVKLTPEGSVLISTPPDPHTGDREKILDPLDFIHAITSQIPDRGQHCVRYLGAYANRIRRKHVARQPVPTASCSSDDDGHDFKRSRRRSWARLLRRILEVDTLLCPQCGVELRIVSVITDPVVVDRILDHRERGYGHDPFEPRSPPAA